MTFIFKTSRRTVDIDNEDQFNLLKGDELSELLYEDKNYIKWMTSYHINKFSRRDIRDSIKKHPDLYDYFSGVFFKLKLEDFREFIRNSPELKNKVKYYSVDALN